MVSLPIDCVLCVTYWTGRDFSPFNLDIGQSLENTCQWRPAMIWNLTYFHIYFPQELFVQCIAQTAYDRTSNPKSLVYNDLSEIVDTDEAFQFLSGKVFLDLCDSFCRNKMLLCKTPNGDMAENIYTCAGVIFFFNYSCNHFFKYWC